MHRATPNNTSHRAYSSGGSRAVVDQVDDSQLMQEMSGNMLAGESRSQVEAAQNYGFTSHNMPADKDGQGNITGSSECFIDYCGGNRGFPRSGPIDDRRHRLMNLSPGDVAMFRTKNDDMQIHLAGDGIYHSAPQMVRMQLVPQGSAQQGPPPPRGQQGGAQAGGQSVQARGVGVEARAGGGGSGGGGGQSEGGQQNKPTGQKAVNGAGKDSKDFMHIKQSEGVWSSQKKIRLTKSKEDDDVLHEVDCSGEKDYCGGTPAKHKFSKVLTLAGPSKNVYGRLP